MKLRLTVLTLAVLLLLTVLPGMTVFAVPYVQAQVTGSVEFENAREEISAPRARISSGRLSRTDSGR